MQIKVYTIEFKLPRWVKRTLLFAGIPAVVLLGVGAVRAAVTVTTFSVNETLSADKLNTNLGNLKKGIDDLQAQLLSGDGVKASSLVGGSIVFSANRPIAQTMTVNPGAWSGWFTSTGCQTDEIVIGGGCEALTLPPSEATTNTNTNVYMTANFSEGAHWTCAIKNVGTAAVTLVAFVTCAKATLTFP